MTNSPEPLCPGCGRDALVLRKPRYDGFKKVGEDRVCASCGHVYAEGAGELRAPPKPVVFGDEDRSPVPHVFAEGEAEKLCRRCVFYVVNPFRQWCSKNKRDVEATDTCEQFERIPEPEKPAEGEASAPRPPPV